MSQKPERQMPLNKRAHDGCFIIRKLCNESLLTIPFVHSLTHTFYIEFFPRRFLLVFVFYYRQRTNAVCHRNDIKWKWYFTFGHILFLRRLGGGDEWLLFKSNVLNISLKICLDTRWHSPTIADIPSFTFVSMVFVLFSSDGRLSVGPIFQHNFTFF